MRKLLPYPVLSLSLLLLWLLLQQSFALGHILLGSVIALIAGKAFAALNPQQPRARRIGSMIKLLIVVTVDVVRSNLAVAAIVLAGRHHQQTAGFVTIPLKLHDRSGLAILACIITATPGSAWLEYDVMRSSVLIHVLDLIDEEAWSEMVKNRYERLLLEIFQ
jgi:multicomponent K+:H+ antiporter subunit E